MTEKAISDIIGEKDKVALYIAVVAAMNKQIPQEYKMLKTESGDRLYGCPACKNVVFNGQKYCDECGQKLKWEG